MLSDCCFFRAEHYVEVELLVWLDCYCAQVEHYAGVQLALSDCCFAEDSCCSLADFVMYFPVEHFRPVQLYFAIETEVYIVS